MQILTAFCPRSGQLQMQRGYKALARRWSDKFGHTSHRSCSTTQAATDWEVLVGLEIHAQIKAVTKLFSAASTDYGAPPNSQVALFDAALPGTLPVLNQACVEAAARTGLALGGTVNQRSYFDRKHYFYADLPHGYQITQQRCPIVLGGFLDLPLETHVRHVRIQRVQLEMDTGKSLHQEGSQHTLLDLNRAGSGLMEIVTEPDLRSGAEATAFVRRLQRLLRHIGSSDGNMEEGSLRVDVNISVRSAADPAWCSARSEIKNLNSTRSVARAVDAEAARHAAALHAGELIEQETRGFDVGSGETHLLRSKEGALDYRFMPEPDLPPLVLSEEYIAGLRQSMAELSNATAARLRRLHGLTPGLVQQLVANAPLLRYFEAAVTAAGPSPPAGCDGVTVANWVTGDAVRAARAYGVDLNAWPASASPERLIELLAMVGSDGISGRQAKLMLGMMMRGDDTLLSQMVSEVSGGQLISDTAELEQQCRAILQEYPAKVAKYKSGRNGLMGLFVGELMQRSKGRANPKVATHLFQQLLREDTT